MMFVNTGMLRSGATESHRAGEHSEDGANHLAGAPLAAGIFGDFVAAQAFHETVAASHAHHVKTLQAHREALRDIGTKANYAAASFTEMENHNAKALRDLRCSYTT
jgi:hypothetical protein